MDQVLPLNHVLVTGGAGFIGSHLVDYLLSKGYSVRVVDNLSSGRLEHVSRHLGNRDFQFVKGDLKNRETALEVVRGVDTVFHLAANPEVRLSTTEPEVHFNENLQATFNLLEACRRQGGVELFVFASSSTVYGDAKVLPTPETHEVKPISVYGASKAGCEALLSSYAHLYGFKGVSLRYANIVGERLRHGVIYDFILKLMRNPLELEILGDGSQRKSYLYVRDAVEATVTAAEKSGENYDCFNIGNDDWITVKEIAEIVSKAMGVNPVFKYVSTVRDGRGWPGDVKFMLLSIEKIRRLGWSPRLSSRQAVEETARALVREIASDRRPPR
ncbi:MAG: NAD-dependent epimerase/dehydratase family protein [Thermosphaera sp.]